LNSYLMFRPIGLTLRAAPALAMRGHPRLAKAGNGLAILDTSVSGTRCSLQIQVPTRITNQRISSSVDVSRTQVQPVLLQTR
jgi:hypothetical protein